MFGAFLLLACNSIFVVGYFGVRAREADRRAELALRGVSVLRAWPARL